MAVSPTVTTQECTQTIWDKTNGRGTITSLGDSTVTQYGHCWNTTTNPTTAHDKTEGGVAPQAGQFTSFITGLTPGTLYYIRAYATNTNGTSYGANVDITTDATVGHRTIWGEGDAFHYFDEYGTERKFVGVGVTSDSDILGHLIG